MRSRASLAIFLLLPFSTAHAQALASKSPLVQFSDDLEALSSRVMPTVVRITAQVYVGDHEDSTPINPTANSSNSNLPDTGLVTAGTAQGSGVLVSDDGYILTNAHVIAGSASLRAEVRMVSGKLRVLPATRVGLDEDTDLAVLKINAPEGEELAFLDITHLPPAHQGQVAIAFGSPFGFERSVTMGIVSAVRRQSSPDDPRLWIQTDAAVNPGNSGGPLVDVRGRLLGINTLIYSESGGNEGIALAIPADTARTVFNAIRKSGHVTRSTLSITTHTLSRDLTRGLGLTGTQGVLVEDVWPAGSGERAGILPGDIVQEVNGKKITSIVNYTQAISALEPKKQVPITIARGDKILNLTVEPDRAGSRARSLTSDISFGRNLIPRLEIFGVTVDPDTPNEWNPIRSPQGVMVVARSSALRVAESSLRPHDVIHAVNGKPVTSVETLRRELAQIPNRESLVLQIERDGNLSYVVVPPG
ncbi:PDZ domain-containing protein [Terriglobus albidus]|uniref:PDZ domain-containing protein n=1 Tax=Terriglobus albidus TaxID=1592106 RepID=A0A5B9EB58_9BACT|nr:trypsin-like peptidase domain-containing protein [Terriglobus albidus]QEE28395.1 PDZ domain-containing protein [Terriglobus albidus]